MISWGWRYVANNTKKLAVRVCVAGEERGLWESGAVLSTSSVEWQLKGRVGGRKRPQMGVRVAGPCSVPL